MLPNSKKEKESSRQLNFLETRKKTVDEFFEVKSLKKKMFVIDLDLNVNIIEHNGKRVEIMWR